MTFIAIAISTPSMSTSGGGDDGNEPEIVDGDDVFYDAQDGRGAAYDVAYDDGDEEGRVAAALVRREGAGGGGDAREPPARPPRLRPSSTRSTHTQASFCVRDGTHERGADEHVQGGHFSATFMASLVADCRHAVQESTCCWGHAGASRATAKASIFMVAVSAAWTFAAYAIPLGDPFIDGYNLVPFLCFHCVAGFACFNGIVYYFAEVVNVPVSTGRMVMATMASVVFMGVTVGVVAAFGYFPVPHTLITLGPTSIVPCFVVVYKSYPEALRKDKRFRRTVFRSFGITTVMILTAFALIMYNVAFQQARDSPLTQSLLAVGLPVVKWLLKTLLAKVTQGGDNPNFAHGAAVAIELEITCLCAVIFTSIENVITFALILALDMVMNMRYCTRITSKVIAELRLANATQRKRCREGSCKAREGEQEGGAGEEEIDVGALANPRVAYLCATLYFSEMAEIIGPLIMAAASLVIYYVVPNDNRTHVTYMDSRVGRTEAEFLRGMAYVLVDAVAEGVTFAVLVAYMRRVVRVDPMHVGWFIVKRHKAYFFVIHVCVCMAFLCTLTRHFGSDTSMRFLWLREDYLYDPGDPTVLWK